MEWGKELQRDGHLSDPGPGPSPGFLAQGTEVGREPNMMEIALSANLVAGAQSETHNLGKLKGNSVVLVWTLELDVSEFKFSLHETESHGQLLTFKCISLLVSTAKM